MIYNNIIQQYITISMRQFSRRLKDHSVMQSISNFQKYMWQLQIRDNRE